MVLLVVKTDEHRSKIIRRIDTNFNSLPEGCIAAALSFTGPRDTCRLAAVSKLFKSAAYSDDVWEGFLPSDYREILQRSDDGGKELESLSRRDLFFYLADHSLLLDDSTKSFFLDKPTGKKCFTISVKELAISWGDTPRYWAFNSLPESRFPVVAQLKSVCWLEIKGKIEASMLSPDTTYAAYLVFKMTEVADGFHYPAEVTVKTPGGKSETQKVYLKHEDENNQTQCRRHMALFRFVRTPLEEGSPPAHLLPKERGDGWLEVEIGELFTRDGEHGEVEMSVLEKVGNWKRGLIVEGIEIRPKVVME